MQGMRAKLVLLVLASVTAADDECSSNIFEECKPTFTQTSSSQVILDWSHAPNSSNAEFPALDFVPSEEVLERTFSNAQVYLDGELFEDGVFDGTSVQLEMTPCQSVEVEVRFVDPSGDFSTSLSKMTVKPTHQLARVEAPIVDLIYDNSEDGEGRRVLKAYLGEVVDLSECISVEQIKLYQLSASALVVDETAADSSELDWELVAESDEVDGILLDSESAEVDGILLLDFKDEDLCVQPRIKLEIVGTWNSVSFEFSGPQSSVEPEDRDLEDLFLRPLPTNLRMKFTDGGVAVNWTQPPCADVVELRVVESSQCNLDDMDCVRQTSPGFFDIPEEGERTLTWPLTFQSCEEYLITLKAYSHQWDLDRTAKSEIIGGPYRVAPSEEDLKSQVKWKTKATKTSISVSATRSQWSLDYIDEYEEDGIPVECLNGFGVQACDTITGACTTAVLSQSSDGSIPSLSARIEDLEPCTEYSVSLSLSKEETDSTKSLSIGQIRTEKGLKDFRILKPRYGSNGIVHITWTEQKCFPEFTVTVEKVQLMASDVTDDEDYAYEYDDEKTDDMTFQTSTVPNDDSFAEENDDDNDAVDYVTTTTTTREDISASIFSEAVNDYEYEYDNDNHEDIEASTDASNTVATIETGVEDIEPEEESNTEAVLRTETPLPDLLEHEVSTSSPVSSSDEGSTSSPVSSSDEMSTVSSVSSSDHLVSSKVAIESIENEIDIDEEGINDDMSLVTSTEDGSGSGMWGRRKRSANFDPEEARNFGGAFDGSGSGENENTDFFEGSGDDSFGTGSGGGSGYFTGSGDSPSGRNSVVYRSRVSGTGIAVPLEKCSEYKIQVQPISSPQKAVQMYKIPCGCVPSDKWKEAKIEQSQENGKLAFKVTWEGCESDVFQTELTCGWKEDAESLENCTEPGAAQLSMEEKNGEQYFEAVYYPEEYCSKYTLKLENQDTTTREWEVYTDQNQTLLLELSQFKLEMLEVNRRTDRTAATGSISASWIHNHQCIQSYWIRLCQENSMCGETVETAPEVGDEVVLDLHQIPGLLNLDECEEYELHILPGHDRHFLRPDYSGPPELWTDGFKHKFVYIPGVEEPRKFDSDMVLFRGVNSVDLEWLVPNSCVHGHRITARRLNPFAHLMADGQQSELGPDLPDGDDVEVRFNHTYIDTQDAEYILNGLQSCTIYNVDVRSIYPDSLEGEVESSPLSEVFRTKFDGLNVPALVKKEVYVRTLSKASEVEFVFVDKCAVNYTLSICGFPDSCDQRKQATFSIESNKETFNRAYLTQVVNNLASCSVYRFDIAEGSTNLTLYKDYLLSDYEEESFSFHLKDFKIELGTGRVEVSWILTQPCITEYYLKVCSPTQECWEGVFVAPEIESQDDFLIEIDLEDLKDFNMTFEDCVGYELTVTPSVNGTLNHAKFTEEFKFIDDPEPPFNMRYRDVTSSSMVVSWENSNCSQGTFLVLKEYDKVIEEVKIESGLTSHMFTNLDPCTDFVIELYGLANGRRSVDFHMMVVITRHEPIIPIDVNATEQTIEVQLIETRSKCIVEYEVELCPKCSSPPPCVCNTVTLENNETSFLYLNLTSNTEYQVKVLGLDHNNNSYYTSEIVSVKTEPSWKMKLDSISSNSMDVLLQGDELIHISYQFSVLCKDHRNNSVRRTGPSRTMIVDMLKPNTEYTCDGHLLLNNDRIDLQPVKGRTEDGIASKPLDLKVVSKTSQILQLEWRRPQYPNGEIQNYKVVARSECKNVSPEVCSEVLEVSDECDEHEEIVVGNQTSFTLSVAPGTKYDLTVSAVTRSNLFGEPSDPVILYSLSRRPHKPEIIRVKDKSTSRAIVEVAYPCPHTGPTNFHTIWTCTNCSRLDERNIKFLKEDRIRGGKYIEVRGLQGGIMYQVRVRASVPHCETEQENLIDGVVDTQTNELVEYRNGEVFCHEYSEPAEFWVPCQYRCNDGTCINSGEHVRCNWINDCVDGSDEWNCTCTGFSCDNGYCIKDYQRCDGRMNCNDGSDESGCPGCSENQFRCSSGKCIPSSKACDRRIDCIDGSDEEKCMYRQHICRNDQFKCYSGRCLDQNQRCNRVPECEQGEDEQNCQFQCSLHEFTCQDGECIPEMNVCDGTPDCLDGSDEMKHCQCYKNQEFACGDGSCLNRQQVCDGIYDCADYSDETQCQINQAAETTSYRSNRPSNQIASTVVRAGTESDGGYPDYGSMFQLSTQSSRVDVAGSIDNVTTAVVEEAEEEEEEVTFRPWRLPSRRTTRSTRRPSSRPTFGGRTTLQQTADPSAHYYRNVSVRVYPPSLEIRNGEDVVFQCRDEGMLRTQVHWSRPGNQELPRSAVQFNGRLEMTGVQRHQAGLYVCKSTEYLALDGSQAFATLTVS